MSKKPVLPPIPLDYAYLNPRVLALTAAPFGMLMRLVIHFWYTDCKELSRSNDELCSLARAHRPTWALYRAEIMDIMKELAPDLRARREEHARRKAHLERLQLLSVSARRLKAATRGPNKTEGVSVYASAPVLAPQQLVKTRPAPVMVERGAGFVEK